MFKSPDETDTLAQCSAVTFGADSKGGEALVLVAQQIGFENVAEFRQMASQVSDALSFYLVDARIPDATKQRLLTSIRASTDLKRKFAPVVCILASGPRHQIIPLVEMGFDEVLFLTDPVQTMASKLREQLRRELVYVETGRYFGPDRRRMEVVKPNDPRRKHDSAGFRTMKVLRDPITGITVSPHR